MVYPTSDPRASSTERQLRLWHTPSRVAPYPHSFARRHRFFSDGFEKDLRAVGVVDAIVGRGAEIRLLHPRGLASQIGHSSRPDFLALHGSTERHVSDLQPGEVSRLDRGQRPLHVTGIEKLRQARDAGGSQIEHVPVPVAKADARVVRGGCKTADFHDVTQSAVPLEARALSRRLSPDCAAPARNRRTGLSSHHRLPDAHRQRSSSCGLRSNEREDRPAADALRT